MDTGGRQTNGLGRDARNIRGGKDGLRINAIRNKKGFPMHAHTHTHAHAYRESDMCVSENQHTHASLISLLTKRPNGHVSQARNTAQQ